MLRFSGLRSDQMSGLGKPERKRAQLTVQPASWAQSRIPSSGQDHSWLHKREPYWLGRFYVPRQLKQEENGDSPANRTLPPEGAGLQPAGNPSSPCEP